MPKMSTLRQDPTTRHWVILAPHRGARPHDHASAPRQVLPERDESCPFCPGNEGQTPPEVLSVGNDTWRVRVVPNLYAALQGDGDVERTGPPLFREMPGVGEAEVVVESPRHDMRLDEMALEDVEHVVRAWRERYRALIDKPHVQAVMVFKNFGPMAGTSLIHPHSQVVAIPVNSPRLLRRLDVATAYFDDTGHCVYDDLIAAERSAGVRIVSERGRFVAFEPFASNSPFETWICPTFHSASFDELEDGDVTDLAWMLGSTVGAMRRACGDPDYNLVLYSAPSDKGEEVFLWHIRILPKLSRPAGFELGSAVGINTVAPEMAAEELRKALAV